MGDKEYNQRVAQTIIQQLGGAGFTAMTGARQYTAIDSGLAFGLPARFASQGINKVRIILTPMDTYTVEFWRVGNAPKFHTSKVSSHEDIYFDMLRPLFEKETGLHLSLGPRPAPRSDVSQKPGPVRTRLARQTGNPRLTR